MYACQSLCLTSNMEVKRVFLLKIRVLFKNEETFAVHSYIRERGRDDK